MKFSEKSAMDGDYEELGEQDVAEDEGDYLSPPSWRSLFNFTSRLHTVPLALALILSVASGVIIPALAIFLGKIFDAFTEFGAGSISGSDLVKKVSRYGIWLVGLGSASGALNAGYFALWLSFGELQARSAREKLFDGMLSKDMEWFDMRKAGIETLTTRLQTRVRELQTATSQPLGFAVQYAVTLFAALGVAFFYSWSLTLVTLATSPLSALVLAWISARMQPAVEDQVEELTKASKLASNAISAIDTVKYFNGQDFETWQYSRTIKRAAKFYLVQGLANAFQIGFVRLVILGMFVQGFWYGSHLVNYGGKRPGDILTAFWACLMATQTIEQLLPQIIVLEKGRAAGATLKTTIVHIEDRRKTVRTAAGKTPEFCDGDIVVRNVSFAYPSRLTQLALNNASFFFPAGETTFVIGASGSGKSTLGNLLLQFYDPSSGYILIDGTSTLDLDINWLRNNVTLVQQQSILFNETIFKNIAFGRRDHSRVRKEEVKRSIETALLQHTISELPQGLETVVGAGGNALSGGQKQRVALARARLRDTPILILDEATSAMDHVSKTLIVEAIRKWRKGKTTIIITHDMSQVQGDDYAYVLEKGIVVQEGYKHTLERLPNGPFSALAKPSIDFPQSSLPSASPHYKRSNARILPTSPEPSMEDSLDARLDLEKQNVNSLTGLMSGHLFSKRLDALISPLSPSMIPIHRHSFTSDCSTPQQRRNLGPVEHGDSFELVHLRDLEAALSPSPLGAFFEPMPTGLQNEQRASPIKPRPPSSPHSKSSTLKESPLDRKKKSRGNEKHVDIAPLKSILLTIWPSLSWPNRILLLLGFFCAAIHAAATPAFSWVFSKLLATFFLANSAQRSQQALRWSLAVLAVALVDSLASLAMHYLLELCGQAWIDTVRIEALKRILNQPRAWFDLENNSLPKLTECLDRNAEEMRNLLGRFAGFVFVVAVMMTVAVTWSLVLSWKLTFVGIASAPFMYAITRSFDFISGKWESKSNDAGEVANAVFAETFGNIRTVRALTLEGYFHEKYFKATRAALKTGLKRSAYSGMFFGLSDSGIIFVTALIFYYGAHLAAADRRITTDILTVFTMLLFSIANANAVVAFIPQVNSSRSTATRLLRLAHLPYQASLERTGNIRLPSPGIITFKNTTFTYPTRPTFPVLSSLNLTLNPSTTTALIGASGSGKSTIASLLLALQAPTSGTITLNNHPISKLHIPTLRSTIAIVHQTPTLFPTTVAANITYGLPEHSPLASLASIHSAAKAAGIHDFITSLPDGYNTLIGSGGSGLSGGQAQRIAIARAIVRRPKLLILDEATSGLDTETARCVMDLVRDCERRGVGVLCITHQRSMMEVCGEVVVLAGGKVRERGSFVVLMGREGSELRRLLGGGETG